MLPFLDDVLDLTELTNVLLFWPLGPGRCSDVGVDMKIPGDRAAGTNVY